MLVQEPQAPRDAHQAPGMLISELDLEELALHVANPTGDGGYLRDQRAHVLGQLVQAMLGAHLGLGQRVDVFGEGIDAFGQLAHEVWQRQQLVGEHLAAQLGPPLGPLLEQPQQVLEVLDSERHRPSL